MPQGRPPNRSGDPRVLYSRCVTATTAVREGMFQDFSLGSGGGRRRPQLIAVQSIVASYSSCSPSGSMWITTSVVPVISVRMRSDAAWANSWASAMLIWGETCTWRSM